MQKKKSESVSGLLRFEAAICLCLELAQQVIKCFWSFIFGSLSGIAFENTRLFLLIFCSKNTRLFDDNLTSLSNSTLRSLPYVSHSSFSNSRCLELSANNPAAAAAARHRCENDSTVIDLQSNSPAVTYRSSYSQPSANSSDCGGRLEFTNPEAADSNSIVDVCSKYFPRDHDHPRDRTDTTSQRYSTSASRSQSHVSGLENVQIVISNDDNTTGAAQTPSGNQSRMQLANANIVGDNNVVLDEVQSRCGERIQQNNVVDDIFKRGPGIVIVDDVVQPRGGGEQIRRDNAVADIFKHGTVIVDDVIQPRGGRQQHSNRNNVPEDDMFRRGASNVIIDDDVVYKRGEASHSSAHNVRSTQSQNVNKTRAADAEVAPEPEEEDEEPYVPKITITAPPRRSPHRRPHVVRHLRSPSKSHQSSVDFESGGNVDVDFESPTPRHADDVDPSTSRSRYHVERVDTAELTQRCVSSFLRQFCESLQKRTEIYRKFHNVCETY